MRRDYFLFGAVNSLDYGVWFSGARTEDTPLKVVEKTYIDGRNGALLTERGRWDNVDVTYSAAILGDFSRKYSELVSALASQGGYQRLEDSLRPDEFRLAAFHSAIQPRNTPRNKAGQFDLVFDCKPQRFLKVGEIPVRFEGLYQAVELYNPTAFMAKPVITVYNAMAVAAAGELSINGVTVRIDRLDDQVTLDCELMDAYRQVADGAPESWNSHIYAPVFPELVPGGNTISWTGGIGAVEIIPRWWTL